MLKKVKRISFENAIDFAKCRTIRELVFIQEQNVPAEEEFDEFEKESKHYLVEEDGLGIGTARWRRIDKKIKLERFAVLKAFRNKRVGESLLQAVMEDVAKEKNGSEVYLHAQLQAIPFYERHGFKKVGEQFSECDIEHYKMVHS